MSERGENTREAARAGTMESLGLCTEDWLIIDEALHRVARSLRKIEKEEKRKKLEEADGQCSADQ